jgi:hypothetical protein
MNPSPGECYDRLTILSLKSENASKLDRVDLQTNFDLESAAIVLYMQDKRYKVPTNLGEELAKINSRLWDLEDAQRKLYKEMSKTGIDLDDIDAEFLKNAITVLQLNDARAATVQKINQACNVSAPEKLHDLK